MNFGDNSTFLNFTMLISRSRLLTTVLCQACRLRRRALLFYESETDSMQFDSFRYSTKQPNMHIASILFICLNEKEENPKREVISVSPFQWPISQF